MAQRPTAKAISPVSKNNKRVVCYYANWSAYRPGQAKFLPQNINPYLCTHLIYAFGGFTNDFTLRPFDKWQDIDQGLFTHPPISAIIRNVDDFTGDMLF